ncbi:NAD-dependent malic enzyme 59 kDa isoform, mitochondrial [Fagus crenata]
MSGNNETAARKQFFLLHKDGLITKERKKLDTSAAPFAKDLREIEGLMQGDGLVESFEQKVRPMNSL